MAEDDSELVKAAYEGWLSPAKALELFYRHDWRWDTAVKAIGTRIQNGLVATITRHIVYPNGEKDDYIMLKQEAWAKYWHPTASHDFWKTGDVQLRDSGYGDDKRASLFGVKFDPAGIRAMLPLSGDDQPEQTETQKSELKPLPKAEAEKFARAILSEWPQASQDWAHEKAMLFFPEHTMSRAQFRIIFRAIQGPKNRGKSPKNGN